MNDTTIDLDQTQMEGSVLTKCYELGGIVWVPHYKGDGYVGPGLSGRIRHGGGGLELLNRASEDDLVSRGARQTARFLWHRPGFEAR